MTVRIKHFQDPKQCSSMNSKTCLRKEFLTTLKMASQMGVNDNKSKKPIISKN